jgi:hypothetical protein
VKPEEFLPGLSQGATGGHFAMANQRATVKQSCLSQHLARSIGYDSNTKLTKYI